jgi:hypothetical protein
MVTYIIICSTNFIDRTHGGAGFQKIITPGIRLIAKYAFRVFIEPAALVGSFVKTTLRTFVLSSLFVLI